MRRYWSLSRYLQLAAGALAAAAALFVLFAPLGGVSVVGTDAGGSDTRQVTLLEEQGPSVLLPVLAPVILVLLPFACTGRVLLVVTIVVSALLLGFCALAGFTIGLFYLPALALSIVALILLASRAGQPAAR